jgi:methanethiol oxidase
VTNSLYASWDAQFYPEGVQSWMVKLEADEEGGIKPEPGFLLHTEQRSHQVHLEGGDSSSDSYCYP